jgi:hypothetical protein
MSPGIGAHEREETAQQPDGERPRASRAALPLRIPAEERRSARRTTAPSRLPTRRASARRLRLAWVGVRFDAQDAMATTMPPATPIASAIAERAAGLIVQLMPAQLSIPSQESTERDRGPSAVIAKPTVSSTSGNSKPPSGSPDPVRDMHLEDRGDHHGADEHGADRPEEPGREREAGGKLGRVSQDAGHHRRPDAETLEARPRAATTGRVQQRR